MQATKKTLITTNSTTKTCTKTIQESKNGNGADDGGGGDDGIYIFSDRVTTIELIGMALNQLLRNKLCRFIAAIQDMRIAYIVWPFYVERFVIMSVSLLVSFGHAKCENENDGDSKTTRNITCILLFCSCFSNKMDSL